MTFHAPPSGAVGGLRWWGIGRHLARAGWQVRLVTAVAGAGLEARPESMSVEEVPPRSTLGRAYRSWRSKRVRTASEDTSDGTRGGVHGARFETLRAMYRELAGLLFFPDEGRGWLLRVARAVLRNARDFQPSVVVSTGPPHSVHLGTWLAMRQRGIPWIADFRDPWADEARLHLDVAWAVPLVGWLEAGVIRSADRILTTTPELASVFCGRFPEVPVTCLPNGVDVETLPPWNPDRAGGLSVVHLGTLYHRRDPIPAVRAFALFLRRHPDARTARSRLRFVGHVEGEYRNRIESSAREEGVASHVEIAGLRPRDEALKLLASSSVSLILAQDQETAVPAKIYEAAGMQMPMLVVTEPESATGTTARRLGAAVHRSSDLEGMARALAAAWSGRWRGELPIGARVDYAELARDAEDLLLEVAGLGPLPSHP